MNAIGVFVSRSGVPTANPSHHRQWRPSGDYRTANPLNGV